MWCDAKTLNADLTWTTEPHTYTYEYRVPFHVYYAVQLQIMSGYGGVACETGGLHTTIVSGLDSLSATSFYLNYSIISNIL